MPINVLEEHPYLNEINYREFDSMYYENLIIGSFPIFSITNTRTPANDLIEHPFNENDSYMRFFYGSTKNKFWSLFSEALNERDPTQLPLGDRVSEAKKILIKHKYLITDTLCRTNRKNFSALDSDLWKQSNSPFVNQNMALNYNISELLEINKNIKYLFFTATGLIGKNPLGWFRDIFGNHLVIEAINQIGGRNISASLTINGRVFEAFLLLSPGGNWARRIPFKDNNRDEIFTNYMMQFDLPFYEMIDGVAEIERTNNQKHRLTQLRKDYLAYHYRVVLQDKNFHFDEFV